MITDTKLGGGNKILYVDKLKPYNINFLSVHCIRVKAELWQYGEVTSPSRKIREKWQSDREKL